MADSTTAVGVESFWRRARWSLLGLFLLLVALPLLFTSISPPPKISSRASITHRVAPRRPPLLPPNPHCPSVDLVYLWVNGSDPKISRDISRITGKPYVENGRLRDVPTLRYSIRAADTYAPWIRKIFLITDGQTPAWLNATNSRVKIVSHSDLFSLSPNATRNLPTFNSNALEARMVFGVPGVGDCWLYQNDDFGFGRSVNLEDFLDPRDGSLRLSFDSWEAPERELMKSNTWHRSIANSNRILNEKYHPDDLDHRHFYEGHSTRFVDTRVMRRLAQLWGPKWEATSAGRFRSENDMSMPFLYNNVALEEFGATIADHFRSGNVYGSFSIDDPTAPGKTVAKWRSRKPYSWCLNDGAGTVDTPEKERKYEEAVKGLVREFEKWFPLPSDLELVSPGQLTIQRDREARVVASEGATSTVRSSATTSLRSRALVALWLGLICASLYRIGSILFSGNRKHLVTPDGHRRDLDV